MGIVNEPVKSSRTFSPAVILAAILLVVVIAGFVGFFVAASSTPAPVPTPVIVDVETEVAALLEGADATHGAELVVAHQCVNCHIYAAGQAAPGWNGLADRAVDRQPPLSAAAYLYESIVEPTAYVVDGYAPAMPQNFEETLTAQEIGDIIAHLLTLHRST